MCKEQTKQFKQVLVFDVANNIISMYRNGVAYGNPYSASVIGFSGSFEYILCVCVSVKKKHKKKKKTAEIV